VPPHGLSRYCHAAPISSYPRACLGPAIRATMQTASFSKEPFVRQHHPRQARELEPDFHAALSWIALVTAMFAAGCSQKPAAAPSKDAAATVEPGDMAISFGDEDLSIPPEQDLLAPCETLRCQQVKCGEGITTSITGKVYIPSGSLPLYNVIVYVPNKPDELMPFTPGVVCDACGAVASGSPLVVALTDENGHFQIDNAPAGDNIPLVIQLGRWRRRFIIDHIDPCSTYAFPDHKLTMPSKHGQGDIPLMAVATGCADPFECLLRKIGIDDKEYTDNTGNGRIHIYHSPNNNCPGMGTSGLDLNPPAPSATALYGDIKQLKKYDVVILPCEGQELMKTKDQYNNMLNYLNAGGRVFTTHWSFTWIVRGPDPLPMTGEWQVGQNPPAVPFHALIDMTFPKGKAFAYWMKNVGASMVLGKLDIVDPRHDINQAYKPPSQRWMYGDDNVNNDKNVMLHMTFNTPIDLHPPDLAGIPMDGGVPDGGWGGKLQCGRAVYSDFHVSTNARNGDTFPQACVGGDMTPQEKALTFMLFDLSACVTPDEEMPEPPIP
jgi:hypothetical protein